MTLLKHVHYEASNTLAEAELYNRCLYSAWACDEGLAVP